MSWELWRSIARDVSLLLLLYQIQLFHKYGVKCCMTVQLSGPPSCVLTVQYSFLHSLLRGRVALRGVLGKWSSCRG